MKPKAKILFAILLVFDIALLIVSLLLIFNPTAGPTFAVLSPKGPIAAQERNLIAAALLLMLVIVIPVFLFTAYIVWKFRGNKTAAPDNYKPVPAIVLWLIPASIIFILACLVWQSTHALDPHKPLASSNKPLTVQVVALQWKWLFIYPEQNIATLNYLEIPEKTPINFQITADNAPMNSLWIPQLGGQMYAMTGMVNQLHLMADSVGEFQGSTAEMSGYGFAGMKFVTKSVSKEDFDAWVSTTKKSEKPLTAAVYSALTQPSQNNLPAAYASFEQNLYNSIVMKYMAPASASDGPASSTNDSMMHMEGMH